MQACVAQLLVREVFSRPIFLLGNGNAVKDDLAFSARSKQLIQRSRVDFPLPDGPIIAMVSPFSRKDPHPLRRCATKTLVQFAYFSTLIWFTLNPVIIHALFDLFSTRDTIALIAR